MIEAHLKEYGIQHFDDRNAWYDYRRQSLGNDQKLMRYLSKYMSDEADGKNTRRKRQNFYECIADDHVGAAIHSFKASAIAHCGSAVEACLGARDSVLDLGCHSGYLTTYYAACSKAREITGWDMSPKAIASAKRHAKRLGIENARFDVVDITGKLPEGLFDVVVSTCSLGYFDDSERILRGLGDSIGEGGRLICVENLGVHEMANAFATEVANAGLRLVRTGWVDFHEFGYPRSYPLFEFTRAVTGPALTVDWEAEYAKALKRLREA